MGIRLRYQEKFFSLQISTILVKPKQIFEIIKNMLIKYKHVTLSCNLLDTYSVVNMRKGQHFLIQYLKEG